MRDGALIPAILFGASMGFIVGLIVQRPEIGLSLPSSFTIPATTIGVGWWINTTLRRRAELDRVALEYLVALNTRLNELVAESLRERSEPKRLLPALGQLGAEVFWLLGILETVRPDLRAGVWTGYIELKTCLTDASDGVRAATAARDLRLTVLVVHLRLCRHLLRRPRDMDLLRPSAGAVGGPGV